MTIREIVEFKIVEINGYIITPVTILGLIIIIISARIILQTTIRFLRKSPFIRKRLDPGRRYALEQFIRYCIYTIAFLMSAQSIGIDLSLIWAGSAALLVGIGLGLQQIFNDFASGVILLVEGEIEVGDVVLVDGYVGTIKRITLRVSHIETREKKHIIVPNSKFISDNVINWGHETDKSASARFSVDVGVAYGSNVAMVKQLLIQAARDHQDIHLDPDPFVYFANFGDSSLDFTLYFFSNEFLDIERVKSDLRFKIDELFRAHHIEIPFPQQDIWFRNRLKST